MSEKNKIVEKTDLLPINLYKEKDLNLIFNTPETASDPSKVEGKTFPRIRGARL